MAGARLQWRPTGRSSSNGWGWAALPACPHHPLAPSAVPKASDHIEQAQAILGEGLKLDRLDQIFDLQRLIGPIIAYKVLLGIVINSSDAKEQRLAASQLVQAGGEEPARVAERLRASVFRDLTLEQLEAVVQTGITDPEQALLSLKLRKGVDSEPPS